jgi:two-component system OmpR family sensor kinase
MTNEIANGTKTESLRWRLTLVSLALLALALIALDAAIYIGLHQRYYDDLRAKVGGVNAAARDYSPPPGASLASIATAISKDNVLAVIERPGRYPVVGKPVGFEELPELPEIEQQDALPDVASSLFFNAVNSNSDLTMQRASFYPASSDTTLFIASKKPVEKSLRNLLLAELIGTALVLGLAVAIVGVAVRLTLRPLDRMAAVADQIAGGDVKLRLQPSKSATELGRLATALDAMLESLSESLSSERRAHERASLSEERMRDFLSDASHELRTPIAGLQWSAETLLRHGHERERREQLSFEIARQARRASQLVADLLSMARLDQGITLERRPFDLAELAAEEVELVREREPELRLILKSNGDCPLVADPERIRQVISNLIDNARKATGGTGRVDVFVGRSGGNAELWVQDSGPGVPEAEREHIFERFVRIENAGESKKGYGSGLGLAIARGFAEAHGGSLICTESNSGARFVLKIPLSGRSSRKEPSQAEQSL